MKPDFDYYDEFPGKEKKLLDEKEEVKEIKKGGVLFYKSFSTKIVEKDIFVFFLLSFSTKIRFYKIPFLQNNSI